MLNDQDIEKLKLVLATKADFDVLTKTTNELTASVDIISKTTLKILETMATKTELAKVQTDVEQIKTDLTSFKTETRENFEKLGKDIKGNKESIEAIVADYHPHIIKLEEKVFGHSTLAEA